MFSFFDIFKSLKTDDVFKYYEQTAPYLDLDGYVRSSSRTQENFHVSPYCVNKKESCVFSIKVNNKGWKLDYSFYYDKKEKTVHANVWFMNLTLSGSKKLQDAITKTFPALQFGFLPSATIVGKAKRKCTKLEQVKAYVEEWRNDFNDSGAFAFLCQFKKNEELNK